MSDKDKKTNLPEEEQDGKYLDGALFAKMAQGGAAHLRANADEVNNLNVFPVPDGDTGDNMSMTIDSGVAAIERVESVNLAEVMSAMSKGMLLGARGNSGVILSQFFSGMSKGFEENDRADPYAVGEAMKEGVKQAYKSVLTPTEGTILTVARESVDYAVAHLTEDSTIRSLFEDLTNEMFRSLQRTPELLEVLRESSVIDSGGAGLFYIMEGFNKVLIGEEIEEVEKAAKIGASQVDLSAFNEDSEMKYGYCTELLLQLQRRKVDVENFDESVIKEFLQTVGNSIVSFKDGTVVKIHVHTMTPDRVLEFCRRFGEFLTVKIENMSVQHNETIPGGANPPAAEKPASRKRYATVAVCTGDGIEKVFRELGADEIIRGGQTKNPSTEDFINAFDRINADHIFVLPNNGNIVMAAQQAAKIYDKAEIHVIESKSIGAGYIAMSYMDFTADTPEGVTAAGTEAMGSVTTGAVSGAIRDTALNGIKITNGDYIGFVGKTVVTSEPVMTDAACRLIDSMMADGKFMLTVFSGIDASEDENGTVKKYISEKYPDAELYFIYGGQEIYPYIMLAE